MAKLRLSVNERGELLSRDGTVVGRLAALTFELSGGTIGGSSCSSTTKEDQSPEGGVGETKPQLFEAPDPIAVVWEHYQRTIKSADRRQLNPTRKGIIRNALKVRTVEQCCKAIDGLAASAWHNGANENRTEYLDIRYALKGNSQRGESHDARIDAMIAKADTHGDKGLTTVGELLRTVPSDRHWIVHDRMSSVIQAILRGERDESAEEALRRIPGVEPIVEEGNFKGWRKTEL